MTPTPDDVIRFWLHDTPAAKRFAQDDALDAEIADRFGTTLQALEAQSLPLDWEASPRGRLAAILVLDQFSRNIHRGSARAFQFDAQALDIAQRLVASGGLEALDDTERKFAIMPYMHSEDLDVQDRGLEVFARHADAQTYRHAWAHRQQIARFGRFPGRNAALHRDSTPEETEYLENGGYRDLLDAAPAQPPAPE